MTDSKGYKITWFSNGDVKQQFKAFGNVKSYYCKIRRVIEITMQTNQKIYYYPQLSQLQCLSLDKTSKEVVFKDRKYEVVDI